MGYFGCARGSTHSGFDVLMFERVEDSFEVFSGIFFQIFDPGIILLLVVEGEFGDDGLSAEGFFEGGGGELGVIQGQRAGFEDNRLFGGVIPH